MGPGCVEEIIADLKLPTVWVAVSMLVDTAILIIPATLLKQVKLRQHERTILKLVFSATLLGTVTL